MNSKVDKLCNNFPTNVAIASKLYNNAFEHTGRHIGGFATPGGRQIAKKMHKSDFQQCEKDIFLIKSSAGTNKDACL